MDKEPYHTVPDHCPPTTALDDSKIAQEFVARANEINNTASGTGKANPLAIEGMIHYDLLHPVERQAASILRLTPNRYLLCKRQIFQAAYHLGRDEDGFNKTRAQSACKVDVNKASKLHLAFQTTDWLEKVVAQGKRDHFGI